jgi:hypothetical protein
MSSLARLAVHTAVETAGESMPEFLVFCSQHGDLQRLREMLRSISTGVELSPTAFSQSVHNASAGLYTILSRCSSPMSSLASGGSTFASGWLEAEGFLVEHPASQVLLVIFDEALPPEYLPYSAEAPCEYALGLLLRTATERGFSLQSAPVGPDETLPMAPLFMAWVLSTDDSMRITADGQGWIWSRATA